MAQDSHQAASDRSAFDGRLWHSIHGGIVRLLAVWQQTNVLYISTPFLWLFSQTHYPWQMIGELNETCKNVLIMSLLRENRLPKLIIVAYFLHATFVGDVWLGV